MQLNLIHSKEWNEIGFNGATEINHGKPVYGSVSIVHNQNGKISLIVRFEDPVVIDDTNKSEKLVHFQFPNIYHQA